MYGSFDQKCFPSRAPGGYLRAEDLIEQLIKLLNKIDLNDMHMKQKFEEEVTRLNKFQKTFFGAKKMAKSNVKQIKLRDYAEYVLREGTIIERREFLGCIKSRFTMRNKIVALE